MFIANTSIYTTADKYQKSHNPIQNISDIAMPDAVTKTRKQTYCHHEQHITKNTPPAKKISFVPKYSDASAPQKNPVITSTTNFIPHPVFFRFNRHALPYSRSLPHKNFLICQFPCLLFSPLFPHTSASLPVLYSCQAHFPLQAARQRHQYWHLIETAAAFFPVFT